MAETIKVRASHDLDFPVSDVWAVLGGFDGLPLISSGTAVSRLTAQGRVRVLTNRDGSILWERLTQFDEAKMRLSYEIIDSKGADKLAYGVGYLGSVEVRSRRSGKAATFVYTASFVPRSGVGRKEAVAAVRQFALDCCNGTRRALSGKQTSGYW
jgi:mxaD protein